MTTDAGNTRKKGLIAMDDANDLTIKLNSNSPSSITKVVEKETSKETLSNSTVNSKVEVQDKFKPSRVGKKEDGKRRKKENNVLYCMDTNIDPKYLKNAEFKTANLLSPLLKIAKTFATEKETTMIDILNVAIYKHLIDIGAIKVKNNVD